MREWREKLALATVLLIVIGMPLAALGYQFGLRPVLAGSAQWVELTGRLPQRGGWSPETIRVEVGRSVRLVVHSEDVVHGFAIGKLGVDIGWVYPGQPKIVEFTPQRAGRYTFYCTTWCTEGHWRMRGILEVYDPNDPAAVERPVDPPQTDWQAEGVNLDAPHPAAEYPILRPSAARGAAVWRSSSDLPDAVQVLSRLDLRRQSPAQVFAMLRKGRVSDLTLTSLSERPPAELWDVVAYLWQEGTDPESVRLGRRLYQVNCAACHGEKGDGKGPAAVALTSAPTGHEAGHGHGLQAPTDFTDARSMAGGSGLIYYGKLVRGGMGTGMPYWGDIFTEQELWALVDYLWTFLFDLSWTPLSEEP
ncbi:MAG: c-type cytochrome [Anaerolineae bacterium]|nr:c-type cytochrome [Anaerolineae bacterium]MDW8100707.1 c-type cytochrome [Anaerolineae bacterium]